MSFENSISNISRVLNLKVSVSLSVTSNNCGLSIQNNCTRIPVWTLCAVDSRGSLTKSDPFSCITVTGGYTHSALHARRHLSHVMILSLITSKTNTSYVQPQ